MSDMNGAGMALGFVEWAMSAIMIVILIIGLWTAWWTRQSGGAEAGAGSSVRSAIDVLGERYARGEISTEEYEERRRVLDREVSGSAERETGSAVTKTEDGR